MQVVHAEAVGPGPAQDDVPVVAGVLVDPASVPQQAQRTAVRTGGAGERRGSGINLPSFKMPQVKMPEGVKASMQGLAARVRSAASSSGEGQRGGSSDTAATNEPLLQSSEIGDSLGPYQAL